MNARDVRYGSGTDVSPSEFYVRFAPVNGHRTPDSFSGRFGVGYLREIPAAAGQHRILCKHHGGGDRTGT